MTEGRKVRGLIALLLVMFLVIGFSMPSAYAEEPAAAQTAGQTAEETEEPIPEVPLEVPTGEATVAEVNDITNTQHSPTVENTVEGSEETFTNDAPSVTITETYTTEDTSDTEPETKIYGLEPDSVTYTLTDTGEPLDKNSQEKVNTIGAETTVTASEHAVPEPVEGSTEPAPTEPVVTITKTTVTESENAIEKAVKSALDKVGDDTKEIAITVAAGTYNGEINIDEDVSLKTISRDNSDLTVYILGEGSYTAPKDGEIIDKSTIVATAAPTVSVSGPININGINVVLAGLYLSLDNKISISGGVDVTIYGTSGDDGMDVTMDEHDNTLTVKGGEIGRAHV